VDGVEHGIDFPMIPSISCLATIVLSLQDESHSPIEAPTIATLSIFSLQSPTLQIEIVCSSREQAGTPPKKVEPVTAILPAGASPETEILCGPVGSLLSKVIWVPLVVGPRVLGWKRIGSDTEAPTPTAIGKVRISGIKKSLEEDVMLFINRRHLPLLFTISGSSTNEPTHTSPKLPLLAIASANRAPAPRLRHRRCADRSDRC